MIASIPKCLNTLSDFSPSLKTSNNTFTLKNLINLQDIRELRADSFYSFMYSSDSIPVNATSNVKDFV